MVKSMPNVQYSNLPQAMPYQPQGINGIVALPFPEAGTGTGPINTKFVGATNPQLFVKRRDTFHNSYYISTDEKAGTDWNYTKKDIQQLVNFLTILQATL